MKKKKEVYTTEIIDKLKNVEQMIKELERKDVSLELCARRDTGAKTANIIGYISIIDPLWFNSDTLIYQNIVSLLEAEAYQLKKQLKESLDIGDNTHWECE